MKVVITGGSGFIGTNLLQFLVEKDFAVLNIDIVPPRNCDHNSFWIQLDIRDFESLEKAILDFNPGYIIHLAARTDLDGKHLDDYSSNILGTENLCKVLANKKLKIKKTIFASSMLVCKVGYIPKHFDDYCPTTIYGQSKVLGEEIVKHYSEQLPPWSIIRPTSIWGPWFDVPYIDFFKVVLSKRFFFTQKRACTKTYGYVENSCNQIFKILFDKTNSNREVFYIGDDPPINIGEWANEISLISGLGKNRQLPYFIFHIFAIFGDILKNLKINFPMSSFRLKNMTKNNIIPLEKTLLICGKPLFNREEAIRRTLAWMGNNSKIASKD